MTIGGVNIGPAEPTLSESIVQAQAVNVMGNGTVRARNIDVPYVDYEYQANRISTAIKEALKVLLVYWKFAATGVAIVDDEGNSFTGYFVGGKMSFKRRPGPFWSASIQVRRYL